MSCLEDTLDVIQQTGRSGSCFTDIRHLKENNNRNSLLKGFLLLECPINTARFLNLTESNPSFNLHRDYKFNLTICDPTSSIKGSNKVKYNRSTKYAVLNYRISVKVTEDILNASQLRFNSKSLTISEKIRTIEKELAIILKPVHPQVNDPLLSTYFVIDIQDRSKAEQVVSHLRSCDFVDSVYIKPDDEPPSSNI